MSQARFGRRAFVMWLAAAGASACATISEDKSMYGLIGQIKAVPGQRDALIKVLIAGVSGMPGCRSYIVAQDAADADAIWVTEVWVDEASHKASLSMPSVQNAIKIGRPMIAGFGERFVTAPVGGHGLSA